MKRIISSICLMGILTFSTIAAAEEKTTEAPRTLRLAVLDLVPYLLQDTPGRPGLLFEPALAILERSGFEADFQYLPPQRLIKSFNEGQSDISVYGDLVLQRGNPNFVDLGLVYTNAANSFMLITDPQGASYTTYLRGKTVAVPTLTAVKNIPGSVDGVNFLQIRNYEVALKMLRDRRVDAVMGLEPTLRYFRRLTLPQTDVHYMEIFSTNVRQFRSLNSPHPQETWDILQATTREMYANGDFFRISERYLPGWQNPEDHQQTILQ